MSIPSLNPLEPNGAANNPNGIQRALNGFTNLPVSPIIPTSLSEGSTDWLDGILELADGSAYRGISFGAEGKSVSGECVFQTGMCHTFVASDR